MRTALEIQNTFNLAMFDGEETGLYYYGARYYNPRISLWYGVDPLNEERYGLSPYQYCQNSPVMLPRQYGSVFDIGPVRTVNQVRNHMMGAVFNALEETGRK